MLDNEYCNLYNRLTVLDAVGLSEVLSRLPNANVKFVVREKGLIISDNYFFKLVADYSERKKATSHWRTLAILIDFGAIPASER